MKTAELLAAVFTLFCVIYWFLGVYIRHVGSRLTRMPPMPDLDMTGVWPPEYCSWPPCDLEDNWICTDHLPLGKHHGPAVTARQQGRTAARGIDYSKPLDDQDATVILAVATEVKRRRS